MFSLRFLWLLPAKVPAAPEDKIKALQELQHEEEEARFLNIFWIFGGPFKTI